MYESEQGKKALRHAVEMFGEGEVVWGLVRLGYPREVALQKVKEVLDKGSEWLIEGGL